MAIREALILRARGESFRFYYDVQHPQVLHITLRHGTSPPEAIRTFFDGQPSHWDEDHLRYESLTDTHGLYWARHPRDGSVIVISCFWRE